MDSMRNTKTWTQQCVACFEIRNEYLTDLFCMAVLSRDVSIKLFGLNPDQSPLTLSPIRSLNVD